MEHVQLGPVTCDLVSPSDFYQLCQKWLVSDHFHHVVTLNAEMVVQAHNNSAFRAAASAATIRVPEGGPLWASSYVRSQKALLPSLVSFAKHESSRVTGVDALPHLAGLAYKANHATYLLGGTASQTQATATLLEQLYPGITVYMSPPHAFSLTGPSGILADIRAKAPALLLVAYGSPKQTLWIERHRKHLPSVRIAIGVGGAFAMLGQDTPRAPKRLRRHNLEWAWRLLLQPHRLPRIWRATVLFPLLIRRQKRLTHTHTPQ